MALWRKLRFALERWHLAGFFEGLFFLNGWSVLSEINVYSSYYRAIVDV